MDHGRIVKQLCLGNSIFLHVCPQMSQSTSIMYLRTFFANFLRSADIKVGSALKRAKYSCDLTINYFPRRDE